MPRRLRPIRAWQGRGTTPVLSGQAAEMEAALDQDNVNLGTCGAQATSPIMHAISRVTDVSYGEIVATIPRFWRSGRHRERR